MTDLPKAERQVGERLSEQQARELFSWRTEAGLWTGDDYLWVNRFIEVHKAYRSLFRQLAEAERENGSYRDALTLIQDTAESEYAKEIASQALHPPDPPASPAEGSEAATEVEA